MDLANGHVLSLDSLAKSVANPSDGIFSSIDVQKEGYFRAFNLGKGKGMSVLNMVEAMKKATGFDYKYEIVGRRRVIHRSVELFADSRVVSEVETYQT